MSQKQANLGIHILTSYNPQKHIVHKGPPAQFRTGVPSGFSMHHEEIFVLLGTPTFPKRKAADKHFDF